LCINDFVSAAINILGQKVFIIEFVQIVIKRDIISVELIMEKLTKKQLFEIAIKKHKILISIYKNTKQENLIIPIVRSGVELSLVSSGFKCQRCKSKDKLQLHHLIPRQVESYINNNIIYFCQRRYYENIIILCNSCHSKYHCFTDSAEKKCLAITKIESIKRKFGY